MTQNVCVPCNIFPYLKPDNLQELCDCAPENTLNPTELASWLKFGEKYDENNLATGCTDCIAPRSRNQNNTCVCPSGLAMKNDGLLQDGQYMNYTK